MSIDNDESNPYEAKFCIVSEAMPMKRNFVLPHWNDLLKWFCKLFLYSFSFTCFVVELFHFVSDVHVNLYVQIHA